MKKSSISESRIHAIGQLSVTTNPKSLNEMLTSASKRSTSSLSPSSSTPSSLSPLSTSALVTRKHSLSRWLPVSLSSPKTSRANVKYTTCQENYHFLTLIGSGASARVYSALHLPTQTRVAIKKIDLESLDTCFTSRLEALHREVQLMSLCQHRHLLPIHQSFVSRSHLHIVMPIMSGSCLDLLTEYHPHGFHELLTACIIKQVLLGLAYLHDEEILHRDVKAANLLISSDGIVVLCDFGVSGQLGNADTSASLIAQKQNKATIMKYRQSFVGSPCWLSPEIIRRENYDTKVDIWSLGITTLELSSGRPPFYDAKDPFTIFDRIVHDHPPLLTQTRKSQQKRLHQEQSKQEQEHQQSSLFHDFLSQCLQKNPQARWSAKELLDHPWIQKAPPPTYLEDHLTNHCPEFGLRYKRPSQHTQQKSLSPSCQSENIWSFSVPSVSDPPRKTAGQPNRTHGRHGYRVNNVNRRGDEDDDDEDDDEDEDDNDNDPITPQDVGSNEGNKLPYYQYTKVGQEMRRLR